MKNNISVVIVTYNGSYWIEKNLSHLLNSAIPVDIIVVDNASTDVTISLIEKFPNVTLIKSDVNLGFGKANNLGIQHALKNGAAAVFLLNQDTWIFEKTIQILEENLRKNPDFGILSPMHFSADAQTLDSNFEMYFKRKINEINDGNLVVVPIVNAAAWLVSKSCLDKVGFFEPEFSHYGEDRNYCDRVRYHGFQIGICTESKICHDRKIVRHFKKDVLQSKYKILTSVLDINQSLYCSLYNGIKEVFGLPKYFFKFFGFKKTLHLLINLSVYYFELIRKAKSIKSIRKNAIDGNVGKSNEQ